MIHPTPIFATATAIQSGGSTGTGTVFLVQIVAIFALFYFLFIRPQQKQRRALEDQIRQVKRGDEVITVGGIVGEVVHVKESIKDGAPAASMEDRITIKSGESRLVIERGRIAKVLVPTTSGEAK